MVAELAHCQVAVTSPSGSSTLAIRSMPTTGCADRITAPSSSTLVTLMATSMLSSTIVSAAPASSSLSRTSTVTM